MRLLVLLAVSFSIHFQAVANGLKNREAPTPEKMILYKATNDNGNVVYILGTTHMLPLERFPFPIGRLVSKVDKVFVENDLNEAERSELVKRIFRKDGEPSVLDLWSPATIERATREFALDMDFLKELTPGFVCILTPITVYKDSTALDDDIAALAHYKKKSVVALDDTESVFKALAQASSCDDASIQRIFKSMAESSNPLELAYKKGDIDETTVIIERELADDPANRKAFITDRNALWAEKIAAGLKKKQSALVAVGAGHLVSYDSLLEMLRKKGFFVNRIYDIP